MNKNNSNPIFKSILLSYVALCAITLAVGLIGHVIFYRMFRQNAISLAMQENALATSYLDSDIQKIYKSLNYLAINPHVMGHALRTDANSPEDVIDAASLQNELQSILAQQSYSDIKIYFYNNDSLLSGASLRYDSDNLSLIDKKYDLAEGELMDILDFAGSYSYHVFPNRTIWFMESSYSSGLDRNAVVIIEIPFSSLANFTAKSTQGLLLAIGDDERLFYATDNLQQEDYMSLISDKETSGFSYAGEKYYIGSNTLPSTNWHMFVGVPIARYDSILHLFWVILIAELVLGLVVALFLSYHFAHKTYTPIQSILSLLTEQKEESSPTFDSLRNSLIAVLNDNQKLEKQVKFSQNITYTRHLMHILEGALDDTVLRDEVLTNWAGLEPDIPFRLTLLDIPDEKLFQHGKADFQNENGFDLKLFILSNVVDELIFPSHPGKLVFLKQHYILICRDDTPEQVESLQAQLRVLIDFYQQSFQTTISAILSDPVSQYESIPDTYSSLLEEFEYRQFWNDSMTEPAFTQVNDGVDTSGKNNYADFLDSLKKLQNFMMTDDSANAYDTLDYIYKNTFPKGRRYLRYNVYRMYALIGILCTTLDLKNDKDDQLFYQELHYEDRLFQVHSVEQLMAESKTIFEAIIAYQENRSKEEPPIWLEKVLAHVQENYTDVNLSVSGIAEIYGLSIPHLSRTFKNCTGYGLLEYIHQVRLEHAKELLKTRSNIQDVAVSTGYLDAKALTRAFKRYEGITPGQYKNSHATE